MRIVNTIIIIVLAASPALCDDAVQLTTDPTDDHNASWSPDGDTIAFTSRRLGDKDIYTIPATGGSPTLIYSSSRTDTTPDWSPDSQTIVFYRMGYDELWKIPATGGTATRFTYNDYLNYNPSWSRDGTKIAFNGHYDKSGGNQTDNNIYWVPANDGTMGPYLIIWGDDCWGPEWKPNGSDIITFTRTYDTPAPSIWVKTLGGLAYEVTDDSYDNVKSSWSPGGQYVAYSSTRSGNWDIWIIPATGGTPIQVTDDPATDWHPDWAPDDNKIVFTSERKGNDDIYVIDVSGLVNVESASLGEIKAHYATEEMKGK